MLNRDLNIVMYENDLGLDFFKIISKKKMIAWDIETSGLDWKEDSIGLCQLYCINEPVAVVKIHDEIPVNLKQLLIEPKLKKVFHHAMFDLRFMCYKWKVSSQNIACTKIASKLLDCSGTGKHSLKLLLSKYLDLHIDKSLQVSNWLTNNLTNEQINYATRDVLFLFDLLNILEKELMNKDLLDLAYSCFQHIPIRVRLEIMGYKDIFTY